MVANNTSKGAKPKEKENQECTKTSELDRQIVSSKPADLNTTKVDVQRKDQFPMEIDRSNTGKVLPKETSIVVENRTKRGFEKDEDEDEEAELNTRIDSSAEDGITQRSIVLTRHYPKLQRTKSVEDFRRIDV